MLKHVLNDTHSDSWILNTQGYIMKPVMFKIFPCLTSVDLCTWILGYNYYVETNNNYVAIVNLQFWHQTPKVTVGLE